ncbi:response regulator transcription factor [Rhabdaerophilum sp. SD176]|uniref:response regulator n=1 Tax=Rhabdaerophilum sp. SD176 TaxID=2983548 RepID=UPI0024DF5FB8|nr:response regulator transcription factor [Rhabdaerophilum sp. SD176]
MSGKRQARILIVDDHPLVRFGLRTALQTAYPGIEVEEGARLAEATARVSSNPPHAVILDLALPDSTGIDTYLALRNEAPDLPIIIVTGSDPTELRGAPDLDDAAAILSKASGPEAIIGHLSDLLPQEPGAFKANDQPALTPRERDILVLCARGLQNKVIGRSLGISENTVRAHLASVFKRFGLTHRGEVKELLERAGNR